MSTKNDKPSDKKQELFDDFVEDFFAEGTKEKVDQKAEGDADAEQAQRPKVKGQPTTGHRLCPARMPVSSAL